MRVRQLKWVGNLRMIATGGSLAAALLIISGAASGQSVPGCGSLENSFGPFDYRDPVARGEPLNLVERAHFTPDVESLRRGNSTSNVVGDIDYTLRAFPNHHRALNSISRYALAGGNLWTNPSVRSADCYFRRAVVFRADDETVRMLYGNYLAKRGNASEARAQYEEALKLAPSSPEVNYNAGLFFLQEGEIDRAKTLAQIAYAGGYPLPGLRKKIAEAEAKDRK